MVTLPLILAAAAGHKPVTKLLLDHRADVAAASNDGHTALMGCRSRWPRGSGKAAVGPSCRRGKLLATRVSLP